MKTLNCPLNGPRNITEFAYGGENMIVVIFSSVRNFLILEFSLVMTFDVALFT